MTREALAVLKKYTSGKKNTEKVEISVLQLNRVIRALEQWSKTGHWIMPQNDDGMSDPICYQVRCSECGFDLDPQTYCEELERVDANRYCPKCGAKMVDQGSEGKE